MAIASQRMAVIPLHHLDIEVASYPLWGEKAFRQNLLELDPNLKSPGTLETWRVAEAYFLARTPALSLDELNCIRDTWWFLQAECGDVSMLQYLRNLADKHLRRRGSSAAPRTYFNANKGYTPRQARWVWRWLSFALPPDLLLCALKLDSSTMASHVDSYSDNLRQTLKDKGFVEPHMHINAGLDFKLAWASLMYALATDHCPKDAFFSPGAAFDSGKQLGDWLIRAAIARLILACFLYTRASNGGDFSDYWYSQGLRSVSAVLDYGGAISIIPRILSEIYAGALGAVSKDYGILQAVYRDLMRGLAPLPSQLDNAHKLDPLSVYANGADNIKTPEMWFTRCALQYIGKCPQDRIFSGIFWQLVRIRTVFYRHLTQRPMTPGLQWFIRFYNRIWPARLPEMKMRVESAALLDGMGRGLRSLEIRTAPEKTWPSLLERVEPILEGFKAVQDGHNKSEQHTLLECGLVIHFPRSRGNKADVTRGHWRGTHADPRRLNQRFRYAQYYRQQRQSAQALGNLLLRHPELIRVIRGIDICTDEMGVPTWVFCPIFKYITKCFDAACRTVHHLDEQGLRLRKTVHAGEDFVHLATGLRKVHESIVFLKLEENDRIGHGMALGVNPDIWAARTGRLRMPKEDRLFDLIWEYGFYHRGEADALPGRNFVLEKEVFELVNDLFGGNHRLRNLPLNLPELYIFFKNLHKPSILSAAGFPNGFGCGCESGAESVNFYLSNQAAFTAGREFTYVETQSDAETLKMLQECIRRKMGGLGIAVEVNPSSNLLIGHLGDMKDHPLWRIMPVEDEGLHPVALCIGTDDPITFATDLLSEYQLVSDSLGRMDFSESQCSAWLEKTRQTGLRSRFTLPVLVKDVSLSGPGVPMHLTPTLYP